MSTDDLVTRSQLAPTQARPRIVVGIPEPGDVKQHCAICRTTYPLVEDIDPVTNQPRDLLCPSCYDNVRRQRRMTPAGRRYLAHWQAKVR